MTATGRATTGALRPPVVAWAVLAAIAISFVSVLAGADGAESLAGRVGGDFPAFYGAGSIVADGDLDDLYDPERQQAAQAALHPDTPGVLYFAYPPPVAAIYAPLSQLPYAAAYAIHTLLMALALAAAYLLVRPLLPSSGPSSGPAPVVVAAVTITFLPVFFAVTLGQNSALAVLLVAVLWRASARDHDVVAGVALGLLAFKPQYALPLLGLQLVRGRLRTVGAATVVTAGWWVLGTAMLGVGWTTQWLDQVRDFSALDAVVNGPNAISWLGVAEHAFGVGSVPAIVVGGVLGAATALILVVMWLEVRPDQLALPVAGAAAGILLISPHAMFYDASLLTLTAAGLAAVHRPRLGTLVAVGWVVAALHPLQSLLGTTPVFVVVVGAFAVAVATWFAAPVAATEWIDLGPTIPATTTTPDGRTAPRLSVVIPAYDEAGRIEPMLDELASWLANRFPSDDAAEVIVVDDGSADDTADRCLAYADRLPRLRVLRLVRNRGKGCAVRLGMTEASGEWRAFLDADGSTAPSELDKLLTRATDASGAAVVIGSVATADAELDRAQGRARAGLGQLGNRLIQRLVLPGIHDSQRGCKLLRGDVADAVFAACVTDGWGFDVEVLARCRALGHEPVEMGIRWEHRPVGAVRPWHYLTTVVDVARIRGAVGRQPVVAGQDPPD